MEETDMKTIEKHFAIWSERDSAIRAANISLVYTEDLKIIDPHFVANGHSELDGLIRGLHTRFPDYSFTLRKPIEQHHNTGRLFWQLGSAEKPDVETGMDVFLVENGKIQTLIVFIDPKE